MTRSIQRSMTRLVVAGGLTVAALLSSVAVAGVASADDTSVPSATSPAAAPVQDDAAKEDKQAEEAAKKAAEEAEKAAKEAAKEQVQYVDGDVVEKFGAVVKSKAPQLSTKFDEAAPALRNLVAGALTKKGVTVIYDGRGQLVIAPYLCDPKKLKLLQPGCVTSLPTPGGGRF